MTMTRTHLLETDLAFIVAREKFPRHQQRNGGAQVTDFGAAFFAGKHGQSPSRPAHLVYRAFADATSGNWSYRK